MAIVDDLVREAYENAVLNGDQVEIDAMDDFELACDMQDKVYGLENCSLEDITKAVERIRMVG